MTFFQLDNMQMPIELLLNHRNVVKDSYGRLPGNDAVFEVKFSGSKHRMQNANLIRPRLWLGNYNAAKDAAFLTKNNINVIYNCTKNLDFKEDAPSVKRRYRIPIDDNLEPEEIENLARWSPEAILLLVQEYRNGSTILVHCAAGMQRSAATVAMFLIATEGMTPDREIAELISKRTIAFSPHTNFRRSNQ